VKRLLMRQDQAMIIKIRGICLIILMLALFSGCSVLRHSQEIRTLQELSASGSEIDDYLEKQKKKFYLLRDLVLSAQIKKGIRKEQFIEQYGDPVLSTLSGKGKEEETLLYRDPTGFFDSDRIYAVFDCSGRLVSWELVPAE